MKTLYLSDLDGTLLRSSGCVSEYTANIVNRFVQGGGCFSYATARSITSASKVTVGINMKFPVVCSDGTFIVDSATNEICISNFFTTKEVESVYEFLNAHDISPVVFACVNGKVRFSFIERFVTPATKHFLDIRIGDPRCRKVTTIKELYSGDIYRFIWSPSFPDKIFEEENRFNHFCRRDYEPQENLCDILPIKATKANAALQLKAILGCNRLIVFGDERNDLPLFSVADEKYAMSNAIPELKKAATAVIDSNDNDGVARWIEKNVF